MPVEAPALLHSDVAAQPAPTPDYSKYDAIVQSAATPAPTPDYSKYDAIVSQAVTPPPSLAPNYSKYDAIIHPDTAESTIALGEAPEPFILKSPTQVDYEDMKMVREGGPLVNLPTAKIDQSDPTIEKAGKAAYNTAAGFINGATGTDGVMMMINPFMGIAGLGAAVPDLINKVKQAELTPPNSPERWQAGSDVVAFMAAPAVIHALSKGKPNAVQKRSTTPEVPRNVSGGENIQINGGGIRQGEQGNAPAGPQNEVPTGTTQEAPLNVASSNPITTGGGTEAPPSPAGEVLGESVRPAPENAVAQDVSAPGPARVEEAPQEPISTKNAYTDAQRVERGIVAAEKSASRDFGSVWDEVQSEAAKDPGIGQRLVESLADNPRALTDKENAHLLHRQIEVQNEYDAAVKEVNDTPGNVVAEARLERARDAVQASYDAAKVAGRETGRGLNARKMLAANDFSLVKMEAETRAVVNKGKPLSKEQAANVKALYERIAVAEEKVAAFEAKEQFEAALKEAKAEARTKGFKLQTLLDRQEARARERIISRRGQLRVTVDPLNVAGLVDEAIIGAAHIGRGLTKFSDWSATMLNEFGERIKPHLEALFAKARELHSRAAKTSTLTPEEREQNALAGDKKRIITRTEQIKEKTAAGDFAKQPKRQPRMDKEKAELLFEYSKAKEDYHRGLIEAQLRDRSVPKKILGGVGETFNTTRALMTSFDLSAVLRQGGFIATGHPIRALKVFPDMLRALASEKAQFRINEEIRNRPNAPLYAQGKLYLAQDGPGVSLSKMEEAYMSRWAKKIPGVGASERAYTTFLNKLRADSFDAMVETLTKNGKPTPEEIRAIANAVNVFTGRGDMGQHATAAATLNKLFFAPRYVLSRFQILTGQPLRRGATMQTRGLIAKEYARALIGSGIVISLGMAAGGEVETDPRSTDFLKLKFGDTRLDTLFGLQQATVLMSRLTSGETKTSAGQLLPIRGNVDFGKGDSFDLLARFARTKLAPIPGASVNLLAGRDMMGQPVTPESTTANLITPISLVDIYKAMEAQGVPKGIIFALLSTFGEGLSTYQTKSTPVEAGTSHSLTQPKRKPMRQQPK